MGEMAYSSAREMIFGFAKKPVNVGNELIIGNGRVIPEVNFTLPSVNLDEENVPEIRERFKDIANRIMKRCVELQQEEVVIEFEHLFDMTERPDFGAQLTKDLKEVIEKYYQSHGIKAALRVTIADIRDRVRPPRMRSGREIETMLRSFELCADAGADILSIESTGGKEISDNALMMGDVEGVLFALGVLGPRDMEFLWNEIVSIAHRYDAVPGGDTACGFANTAMQLAHQGLLPKVLAAVVRLMSAPRSLVAVEVGAVGPLKDCGYENPVIKAITGVPISMEGKTSACAHSSPLGNIAAAVCDLWSNESVQDVKLLSGNTPEVFTEMLIYDCRLMNTAIKAGKAESLRDLMVDSDRFLDPQALVLDPEIMYEAAHVVVRVGEDKYKQTVAVSRYAYEVVKEAETTGKVKLRDVEKKWLEKVGKILEHLPEEEEEFYAKVKARYEGHFVPEEYGLK
ncbi:MAG: methanol---5-hydroxybenzimidazolylcobamide Co-methyltransferase [Thermotogota bacterium]|nr:methanol---5-hydroxybenzimidazolylcobamide Co-methyltransferase [Thermotogota bacterium]